MKKITVIMLIGISTLFFTACGGGGGNTTSTAVAPSEPEPEEPTYSDPMMNTDYIMIVYHTAEGLCGGRVPGETIEYCTYKEIVNGTCESPSSGGSDYGPDIQRIESNDITCEDYGRTNDGIACKEMTHSELMEGYETGYELPEDQIYTSCVSGYNYDF